jgi:hypothetical protein
VGAVQESLGLKHENLQLKMLVVQLQKDLRLEPSFDEDVLQEQQNQLYQQTQQAAWQVELQQQYLQQAPSQGALQQMGEGGVLGAQGSGSGNFGGGLSGSGQGDSSSGDLQQQERNSGSQAALGSTPPDTPKAAS